MLSHPRHACGTFQSAPRPQNRTAFLYDIHNGIFSGSHVRDITGVFAHQLAELFGHRAASYVLDFR